MTREESAKALAGVTALAKVQATKVFEYCAREAAQIFGGASYTRGGVGEKVERLYRDVRAYAIPGGSEEIMICLLYTSPSPRDLSTSRMPSSA